MSILVHCLFFPKYYKYLEIKTVNCFSRQLIFHFSFNNVEENNGPSAT